MKPFFADLPEWDARIGQIYVALERVRLAEDQVANRLRLRRRNRIRSVHSSTAIEGNRLSEVQVRGVVNGATVFGLERDVKEVQDAWAAYEALDTFDPYSVDSFLQAHALMTDGLITESGMWRTNDVEVVGEAGEVRHTGADPDLVPEGMRQLLVCARDTPVHPLIASSATHFMIEFIHPFQDGNGRMGRLWQTLMLSRWNELFAWMPTETLVHHNQAGYYQALQASHNGRIEASPFITYMLDVMEQSLQQYGATVMDSQNEGVSDGVYEGVFVRLDGVDRALIDLLQGDGSRTASQLADSVGRAVATVERHLSKLKRAGIIQRQGSDKTGVWVVQVA